MRDLISFTKSYLVSFGGLQVAATSTHLGSSSPSGVSIVEPSGVQVLKNPNPLKDVEASAVLDVAVPV